MTEMNAMHNIARKRRNTEEWWLEKSTPEKIAWGFLFGIAGLAFIALCGWIVMLLWNWLMPDIFGLKEITYWQAWGLFILSSILFKGIGGSNHGPSDKKRKRKLRAYLQEEESAEKVPAE